MQRRLRIGEVKGPDLHPAAAADRDLGSERARSSQGTVGQGHLGGGGREQQAAKIPLAGGERSASFGPPLSHLDGVRAWQLVERFGCQIDREILLEGRQLAVVVV